MTPNRDATAVRLVYVDAEEPPASLASHGVAVTSVGSVAAARERLADCGDVDCVVTEYDLPDGDGIDLLETIRDDHPNLPVVLFTDSGSEAVASEALGKGVTDYLPKDAGGESLRKRVGRAVAATSVEADSGLTGDRMRELTNAFPDVAFIIDEDGRYLELLSGPTTADLETVERERLVGQTLYDAFEESMADRFLEHIRTTLSTGGVETIEYRVDTDAGERWFEGRTAPLGSDIDGRDAVVWVARDVTDRRENERRLTARGDELETLNRINDLIHGILDSLVESGTREEVERTVCEGLADSEFYQFAWIGGPWVKDERMDPSVIAGADREGVERLVEATSARSEGGNSFTRVVQAGESVVVPDVSTDARLSEHERECMLDLEMSSAVLLPLTYGNTNYGVLGISGACSRPFGDREQSALEALAEVVAFAINAVKNRNLLFADTAIELEFRVRDADSALARTAAELECRFVLEGFVEVSEDRLLEYVAVEDASASAIRDALSGVDASGVEEFRVVTDDADECLLEILCSHTGVTRLVKAGTVVKSGTIDGGDIEYVTEAPSDANVRSVVDSLRLTFPDAKLVSKQEVGRPVHTAKEFRQTLNRELTEKQQTALQTAYFAGYYEYPRESTAEEVADSLGVSSPTLHQHLRAAQRKLVGTFLD
ncbi:helix-turn-helix domain-containing protein [Halorussus salilacus]|uniref:bacterio-opsin activator domain-containing protein n=1 Tax=Halorussus salilacus TaxID=2953750 RepID=UPI00209D1FDE|nr:bacterio-opsin activator domain-containing protein [Halorussus salilacus]USZ67946.1 helix-turn-helix domain-containing protein [Halorussus salilacus]